jgi:histidinol-phosphate/aromatic aminotransferase/cobyric acid decarboxylase-like protein
LRYVRMPIEVESPEEYGYARIRFNLSESSIADQKLSDLGLTIPDMPLLYGEHRGRIRLREIIAADGVDLTPDDVLATTGAAGALFIIATALLRREDHLVVIRPNYATNLETPKAIGCQVSYVDLAFEEGFRVDPERVAAAVTPATRLISITCPHNPTGVMLSEPELRRLVQVAATHGCRLLVDETYRDLSLEGRLPVAASLGDHVISVASLSKAYGVPGIRCGWLVTRDPALQELFLAAREQIGICGSVIDEWVAEQVMEQRDGQRLDRRRGPSGMGQALRGRGLFPAHEIRAARGDGCLLPSPAGGERRLCRAGPLVRDARQVFPRRLWLAVRGGVGRWVGGDFGGAERLEGLSDHVRRLMPPRRRPEQRRGDLARQQQPAADQGGAVDAP